MAGGDTACMGRLMVEGSLSYVAVRRRLPPIAASMRPVKPKLFSYNLVLFRDINSLCLCVHSPHSVRFRLCFD
jgi:hypothetical protein